MARPRKTKAKATPKKTARKTRSERARLRPEKQFSMLPMEEQLRRTLADALALIERVRTKADVDTLYRFDRADKGVVQRLRRLAA